MSLLADALQPIFANGIISVGGRLPSMSLSGAITAPKAAYSLIWAEPDSEFSLDFREPNFVRNILASDSNRLATSCFQSISLVSVDAKDKYGLPWSLIQLYYAAFYAAHSIVRILGTGCCSLEAGDATHLKEIALAVYGDQISWPIKGGPYRCDANTLVGTLSWKRLAGRPHEALWDLFHEILSESSDRILQGPLPTKDSQSVIAKIETFRNIADNQGSKSWLSRTRNDIQYKLQHGVWHPTAWDKKQRERLSSHIDQWRIDPMEIDLLGAATHGNLPLFCAACAFVISVCRILLVRIRDRALGDSKSFFTYGPFAFAGASKLNL